eukprot:SAG25_NODE_137_length_14197_cov_30.387120_3_plen_99_part_00
MHEASGVGSLPPGRLCAAARSSTAYERQRPMVPEVAPQVNSYGAAACVRGRGTPDTRWGRWAAGAGVVGPRPPPLPLVHVGSVGSASCSETSPLPVHC